MTTPVQRRCPCCNGTGFVPLTSVYARTLELLRRHPEVIGAILAEMDRCKGTAMSNRLATLERMGLATSTRDGRERWYRAVLQRQTHESEEA